MEKTIAENFSNFFQSIVSNLKIGCDLNYLSNTNNVTDPIDIAIDKFKNHPSINLIKENTSIVSSFNFTKIKLADIEKEILNLDRKKNGTFKNIPTKILKETSSICSETLLQIWNEQIINLKTFPKSLKLADITPIFKKGDSYLAENYRPISVLPTVSKIFERLMQKQLIDYIDKFFVTIPLWI